MEYPCLNDEKKLDTVAFAKTGEYLKESWQNKWIMKKWNKIPWRSLKDITQK